jgi:AcrR family transcriptional regulator
MAILDAAKRAFVRDGVGTVSIDAIAMEAGVSRQTVYNQLGDKDQLFRAVIEDVTARSSASLMAVLVSFPSRPDDIQTALTDFAVGLLSRCLCDIDGRTLIMLLEKEAYRYPELFLAWKEYGPGKDWPLIAGHFARLAHEGYLDIDDASLAARQFMRSSALTCRTTRAHASDPRRKLSTEPPAWASRPSSVPLGRGSTRLGGPAGTARRRNRSRRPAGAVSPNSCHSAAH